MTKRAVAVLAIALAALATGACGSSSSDSGSPSRGNSGAGFSNQDTAGGSGGAVVAPGEAAAPGGAPNEPAKDGNGSPVQVGKVEKSIIYTGSMTVRVDKVDSAADEAGRIATAAGGHVGSDKRTIDADRSVATVVLRVPADAFTSTLAKLAGLGTEETRAIEQQDVTEAVVDLDARIESQQASVNRVRALLAQAKTVGEVVSVESELTRRESDLASLEARKRNLTDAVALSTITLSLEGPAAEVTDDEPDSGFLAGLKSGWKAFVGSVKVLLTVLGAILPFVLIVGVPLWALYWFLRRRRAGRLAAPRPAVATTYGLPAGGTAGGGTTTEAANPDPTAPKSTVD